MGGVIGGRHLKRGASRGIDLQQRKIRRKASSVATLPGLGSDSGFVHLVVMVYSCGPALGCFVSAVNEIIL